MSWLRIPVGSYLIKVKPRSQMRTAERTREAWVLDLGVVIVSVWSPSVQERHGK